MIVLRRMLAEEYSCYLKYFIPDYAQEIASNYPLSGHDPVAKAEQEIAMLLPDGVNTPGQVLLCLIDPVDSAGRHVGYLWYKPDFVQRSVFIYDFYIFNAYQGQGLAKKALLAFELSLQEQGFEQIKLRVAADNARARHVYETTGFGITGINMSKTIKHSE